jgi:hypothetical protein
MVMGRLQATFVRRTVISSHGSAEVGVAYSEGADQLAFTILSVTDPTGGVRRCNRTVVGPADVNDAVIDEAIRTIIREEIAR